MANKTEPRQPINPLLWWADLGLGAAEATVAATQNMAESWMRWTSASAQRSTERSSAGPAERAMAADEARPRRKAAAKPKRTKRASRK